MTDPAPAFDLGVPAWRARRLRAHLLAQFEAGLAARRQDAGRVEPSIPAEVAHRAERRRWLAGWRAGHTQTVQSPAPTPRQIAKITRWQAGAGRLRPADGERRRAILEAVADEMLALRPPPHGAIAAAHRESARRCREAGLPAPKGSRYRKWLKLTRGV